MSSDLRAQIRNRMALKQTDELLEIWQSNHRFEWSDDAFEVIREILKERGVELPKQDEPVYEAEEAEETAEDDDLEEWEAKVLDDENQPEFYDTLEVLALRDNIDKVAGGAIIVYILLGLLNSRIVSAFLHGIIMSPPEIMRLFPIEMITILSTALQIVLIYFPLKALAHILRILMEMEFRSRKGI